MKPFLFGQSNLLAPERVLIRSHVSQGPFESVCSRMGNGTNSVAQSSLDRQRSSISQIATADSPPRVIAIRRICNAVRQCSVSRLRWALSSSVVINDAQCPFPMRETVTHRRTQPDGKRDIY
jgi:hypothetical protein